MREKREPVALHAVDLVQLREKGVPVEKISKMLDIPVQLIQEHFDHVDRYKFHSGVF
jgi:hypothetical protein